MKNLRCSLPALSAMLLMAFNAPSYANNITGATGTVTCSNFSLEFTGTNLNPFVTYSVQFSFTLTPVSGTPRIISGTVAIPAGTAGPFDVTTAGSLVPPLTTNYTITSSSAQLFAGSTGQNMVSIVFTSTTVACAGTGICPVTQGFWKTHFPGAWPPSVIASGLTIGSNTYTAAQLEANLETPPEGGNALLILSHQLVAALLNKAAGAVDNPTADAAIATAQMLIDGLNINVDFVAAGSTLGEAMTAQATILDGYNSSNFNSCQESQ
jgi:hypothetical protein